MMAQCTFTICENPAVPMLHDWWGAVRNQYLIIPIWQTDIIGHQSQTLHFMRWNQMYLLQQLWMENLSNLNKYFFMYVLISCWFNLSQFFKSFQHWLWKSSMKLRKVVSLKHTLRYLISKHTKIIHKRAGWIFLQKKLSEQDRKLWAKIVIFCFKINVK